MKESGMKWKVVLMLAAGALAGMACGGSARAGGPPLQTVQSVDLERYLGVWYEIARYPNSFQKGCLESRARYSRRPDGDIEVVNSCRDAKDGRLREAKGRAWVVDKETNARLKVSFFWPFRGDYWIIELGQGYQYAVVGTPNRKYLWVLSRDPVMDEDQYREIVARAARQGFDPARLQRDPPGRELAR